jgi:hypothetical protein
MYGCGFTKLTIIPLLRPAFLFNLNSALFCLIFTDSIPEYMRYDAPKNAIIPIIKL